ncbi:MAG: Y-family DNA polymerase [Candidatus Saccharimonadales bacterium]
MNNILALIDCNNFFASCEKLFRADLEGRPVVVLSSNDGCVVARSNEAKALGIPMGAPAWQYRDLFKSQGIVQFSANFELYGDISERITNLLTTITPHIEIYSVDESFLDLSELDIEDYNAWGRQVRDLVLRYIGVPVSIGIAPSKTLCKLAADHPKKLPGLAGALSLLDSDVRKTYLKKTEIKDIWGVGWKLRPRLQAEGIYTALDLAQLSPKRAQQLMGIHGRQMVAELNGLNCHDLQKTHKPQAMIMRGRQFGEDTSQLHVVEAAVASLTASAAHHLRRERQLARQSVVLLSTNRNKPGYRRVTEAIKLMTPTADTGTICSQLVKRLQATFNRNLSYHRADVLLYDFVPETSMQTALFGNVNLLESDKSQSRMQTMDAVNIRFGRKSLHFAAEGLSAAWRPKKLLRSPRYTSAWTELPEVKTV